MAASGTGAKRAMELCQEILPRRSGNVSRGLRRQRSAKTGLPNQQAGGSLRRASPRKKAAELLHHDRSDSTHEWASAADLSRHDFHHHHGRGNLRAALETGPKAKALAAPSSLLPRLR